LSKAIVSKPDKIQAFASMLRPVEIVQSAPVPNRSRLGRTAQAVEEARRQGLELGRQEGYEAGFVQGLAEGELAIRAELEDAKRQELEQFSSELERTVANVKQAMQDWFQNAEEALAPLALEIAREILGQELEVSEESALAITRKALGEVTHSASARIRVNPYHSELLRDHAEALQAAAPSLRELAIVDDPSIRGGCIIDTEGGVVDGTVASQLEAIREGLRGAA
jgi:flagellar biosynthesis/type III secretory pathway protein FliH